MPAPRSTTNNSRAISARASVPCATRSSHICGAEWIWLERWHGRSPDGVSTEPADFPDLESVRRRWAEIERDLLDYVASLTPDDLQRVVQFKTHGRARRNAQPLWQLLQHLANHSTYHRGQVTTLLRQLGAKARRAPI